MKNSITKMAVVQVAGAQKSVYKAGTYDVLATENPAMPGKVVDESIVCRNKGGFEAPLKELLKALLEEVENKKAASVLSKGQPASAAGGKEHYVRTLPDWQVLNVGGFKVLVGVSCGNGIDLAIGFQPRRMAVGSAAQCPYPEAVEEEEGRIYCAIGDAEHFLPKRLPFSEVDSWFTHYGSYFSEDHVAHVQANMVAAGYKELADSHALSAADRMQVAQQLIKSIGYLHANTEYTHNDIKADNLWYNPAKQHLMVFDWGAMTRFDTETLMKTPTHVPMSDRSPFWSRRFNNGRAPANYGGGRRSFEAYAVAMTVWGMMAANNEKVYAKWGGRIRDQLAAARKKLPELRAQYDAGGDTVKRKLFGEIDRLSLGKEQKAIYDSLNLAILGMDFNMSLAYYPYLAAMLNASSEALEIFMMDKTGEAEDPAKGLFPIASIMRTAAELARSLKWTEEREGAGMLSKGGLQITDALTAQLDQLLAMFDETEAVVLKQVLPRVLTLDDHRRPSMALFGEMMNDVISKGEVTEEIMAKVQAVDDRDAAISFGDVALCLAAAVIVAVIVAIIIRKRQAKN